GSMTVSGANTVLNVSGTIAILNTPNSKFTFSSGTVNANAIDVSGTPSLFSWTGGTLNITTDVTWDSGGAPNSTSVIFGNGITLTSGKTLNVAGNETIGGSGTFAMTLNSNAVHAVTGDITLKAGGIFSETVTSFLSYNNFIHAGGTLGGTFHNIATYIYQSGSFSNVQFINDGPALFSGSASINGSVQNNDQINLTAGQSFSASGITNSGTFNMNGATIGSGGTFTNSVNGTINAKGTINSTLINHGILNVSGALNLTNGLTNNDGVISGGGTISGAPVSNAAGGVITGDSFNSTLTIANFLSNAAGGIMNVNFGSSLSLTSSWTNTGLVNLNGSQARLGGGTIANNGTIQGAGSINAALNNSSGIVRANGGEIDFAGSVSGPGQFQATANSTLMFLQGLSSNGGTITLTGGTLDNNNHALTNSHIISGYGTLRTSSLNNAASQLISIAEGNIDVFGSFTNNGVVNIQSGRSAYFYGAVNGSGSFTGTGTAVFLTGLSPGNSPATMTMSGGATLVGGTSLSMELGGATAGTQYDQLHVGGELSIGGILAVSLINGFVPAVGSSFDLLDWGTLSGTFSTLSLPTLAGAQWDTSKLYTTGVLSVVAGATLPGDYNNNGVVDAADYVVWRAGLGTIYVQNDYNVWRAHFGQTAGSGSSLSASGSASVAVPEPASAILMLCGVAAVAFSNRRRSKS
ncbi:MAG TPA: PEP-CTERM sorting domain-containing protein, partial [Lacipirellulaceae bacterium]|nr:PEP-CTERM sorting domain-containing protein [Lacipirellulaceae bacterium]